MMVRRKKENRRRTGCFQCKQKHVQCTEEHPRCRRCEVLGLQCVRGLRLTFREDAMQRGLSFGREGVWTKRPFPKTQRKKGVFQGLPLHSYINRWIFLNVTVDDFKPIRASEPSIQLELAPSPTPFTYHPFHTFPETDSYLLDYFIRGISPSCSLSTSHNPYISLVIPLCFTSQTLRNALLAVAANQLCLLGRPQLRQEACHYKDKALQGLQRELSNSLQDEGAVAAVVMLCFQDISDGCSPSWMTHLRGGLKLINCNTSCNLPSLWKFFRMYFVAHDIMSRTAFNDGQGEEADSFQLWSDGDDLEEIDVLMGCSRGLMSLIHRISVLASTRAKILDTRPLTTSEQQSHTIATIELHHALVSLKQTLPGHSDSNSNSLLERNDLERIADIKRLTALLYLTERLGPLRQTLHNNDTFTSQTHLITSIIESISTLPDMATLLWPLFVLGNVKLENEEHRRFVLDRLLGIQKSRNLGSVRRAIEAVKHSFGTKDLGLNSEAEAEADLGFASAGSRSRSRSTGLGGLQGWGQERVRYISLA